jgi:ABC-2 type transport system ATP-binding protein
MITGILTPDYGHITVNGRDLLNDPISAKLEIGYVPDNHAVYEKLKGIEYLNFMADIYGVDRNSRRDKITHYLKIFNMTQAANDMIRSYSHGMKQKICVIGALLHDPKLWILDEPLTGLDPQSSFVLKQLMREHVQKGNTVFFSSHILEVVEKLCDRIAIIDKGRIIDVGTIEQIKSRGDQSLEQYFLKLTADGEKA